MAEETAAAQFGLTGLTGSSDRNSTHAATPPTAATPAPIAYGESRMLPRAAETAAPGLFFFFLVVEDSSRFVGSASARVVLRLSSAVNASTSRAVVWTSSDAS